MQNSPHNQRLMREALGNTDGEMPVTHGNLRAIAAVAIILFVAIALAACQADERLMIAASTSDAYLASANNDALTLKTQEPLDKAVPEAEVKAQPQGETGKEEPEGNVVDMTY